MAGSSNFRKSFKFTFTLVLTLMGLIHVSSALKCPRRSSEEKDTYDVQGRLDIIFKDSGYVHISSELCNCFCGLKITMIRHLLLLLHE